MLWKVSALKVTGPWLPLGTVMKSSRRPASFSALEKYSLWQYGTTGSVSPWMTRNFGSFLSIYDIGFMARTMSGFSADGPPMITASGELASLYVSQRSIRLMSIGPNQSTTASTALLSRVYCPSFPSISTFTFPNLRVFTPLVVPAKEER